MKRFLLMVALLVCPCVVFGQALDVKPGDLLVGEGGALLKVNPSTGQQTMLFPSDVIGHIFGIDVERNGDLLIGSYLPNTGESRVVRVDRLTSAITVLAGAGAGTMPWDLKVGVNGTALIAFVYGNSTGLISIDLQTGAYASLGEGIKSGTRKIAVSPDGKYYTADP